MNRQEVFTLIDMERKYQTATWGDEFDSKNTPNDWIAYIVRYAGKAVTMPFNRDAFRNVLLKVAALCVAVLERETYAPRHYDQVTDAGTI